MLVQEVQIGQSVRTRTSEEGMIGTGLTLELTRERRSGIEGIVQAPLENHRGELWTVRHADGVEAVYFADELLLSSSMPGGFR